MIWMIFAALVLGTLALLLLPVFKGKAETADRASYDVAVFKDQLKEVDADLERGLLTAAQAEAARIEIKRRMLAAAESGAKKAKVRQAGQAGRFAVAAIVAVLVPVGAAGLYGMLGAPSLPDQPFAARDLDAEPPHQQMAEIEGMVDTLAQRLQQEPDNVEGWIMLARSAKALERYEQAAGAYRRAIALGANDAEMQAGFGETLMFAANGTVPPEAVQAFEAALKSDPADPRSRFYLGMAREQAGDIAGAIAVWKHLEKDAPADAPWLAGLRSRIAEAAGAAGIDAATVEPKPPVAGAGGTPAVAAAPAAPAAPAGQTPEEQQAMVQGMIDGLAARLKDNPDDATGWQRLGRAYRVQEKFDLAKDAYGKAMALLPKDVDVKLAYADVLLAMVPQTASELPPELTAVLQDVLALEPENPDALYFLGVVEAQAGRKAEAKALWSRLLGTLPEGSPERAGLKQQIDQLGG